MPDTKLNYYCIVCKKTWKLSWLALFKHIIYHWRLGITIEQTKLAQLEDKDGN